MGKELRKVKVYPILVRPKEYWEGYFHGFFQYTKDGDSFPMALIENVDTGVVDAINPGNIVFCKED